MHYMQRDSTEILHRKAKMYRLCHRRKLHLLTFAYKLSQNDVYLDHRDIPTRQHVGKLFMFLCINIIEVGADGRTAMPSLNTQNKNNLKKEEKKVSQQ